MLTKSQLGVRTKFRSETTVKQDSNRIDKIGGLPLPDEITLLIFAWLTPNELGSASSVCKIWKQWATIPEVWERVLQDPATRQKSFAAMYTAVVTNNSTLVQHYCRIGFQTQFSIRGNIERKSDFNSTTGFFKNPSLLSVAANSLTGTNGASAITALLKSRANASVPSKIESFSSASSLNRLAPVIHIKSKEIPAKSACDKAVRTILLLAHFETAITEHKKIDEAILILKQDREHDEIQVKEYMMRIIQSEQSFKGVQHVLTADQLTSLKADPEFTEWFKAITIPSKCCVM